MREYEFELRLCAHLECAGRPGSAAGTAAGGSDGAVSDGAGAAAGGGAAGPGDRPAVVARQLGAGVGRAAGRRVMDVVLVEPGPQLDERVALTPETIPAPVLEGSASVAAWREVTDTIDRPPRRAHEVADRAVEVGFLEESVRRGSRVVRRSARYPERWYGELVGIENKPDLGTPGDLADQLRTDVSLGLLDRVVLATESYVTGAHLNRLPDAVGIWRVDLADPADPIEVVRPAAPLAVDEPGIQLLERHPGRADVRVADAAEKARYRRRLAERAYGKGWRPHFPACRRASARVADAGDVTADTDGREGTAALPHCAYHGRVVDPGRDCEECPAREPGRPPRVDVAAERARRQPWDPDPEGRARRQATLDGF